MKKTGNESNQGHRAKAPARALASDPAPFHGNTPSAPAPAPAPASAPVTTPASSPAPAPAPADCHVMISSGSSSDEHAASEVPTQGTVHVKSSRCIDCRIVVSNGISAKHHGAPVGHHNALFEFCVKETSAKCFVSEECRTLMFAGLKLDSKKYEQVTGQQLETISGASVCVCLGFILNKSGNSSGVLLENCSLQFTDCSATSLHCILGLPPKPKTYDENEKILEYEQARGASFVVVDDFLRLIEGKWVSDRLGPPVYSHVSHSFYRLVNWYVDYLYDAARGNNICIGDKCKQ